MHTVANVLYGITNILLLMVKVFSGGIGMKMVLHIYMILRTKTGLG